METELRSLYRSKVLEETMVSSVVSDTGRSKSEMEEEAVEDTPTPSSGSGMLGTGSGIESKRKTTPFCTQRDSKLSAQSLDSSDSFLIFLVEIGLCLYQDCLLNNLDGMENKNKKF